MLHFALTAPLVFFTACDSGGPDTPDFGFGYDLIAESVALDDGMLRATVQYSGGCRDHTFSLRTRFDEAGAEVWLVHGGTPDPCDAYLSETVEVAFDLGSAPVVLLDPAGGSVRLR